MLLPDWPHQQFGTHAVVDAIGRGVRRLILTCPTGGGKSRIMTNLILWASARGLKSSLYTNRKMLIDQTSGVLDKAGIAHGVRAAGHWSNLDEPVQISSVQTELSRVVKRGEWPIHQSQLVLVDEGHLFNNPSSKKLIDRHLGGGATVVYVTATPLDLDGCADELIVAGTTSELRACGALVRANHVACSEPDFKAHRRLMAKAKLTEGEVKTAMMQNPKALFGNVFEWFGRLNPERKPSILFAPGVAESLWFAEEFHKQGITAAHVDGEDVWVNGQAYKSSPQVRKEVLDGSRNGSIAVLCNRYVLREGIDCPWLQHGIFATVFGSLQSYLQSGGRLLRRHRDDSPVTIADHGGNWHRYGSLNEDREWSLDLTADMAFALRQDAVRDGKKKEPFACPGCGVLQLGRVCANCKREIDGKRRSRPVLQSNGRLIHVSGSVVKPRATTRLPDTADRWEKIYHGSMKRERTFRQAYGWFKKKYGYEPPRNLKFMPKREVDWFRLVKDVPKGDLH
jgi:DNA repair protein RadD